MSTIKVVLDTNVLLSGLAYPGSTPGKVFKAWFNGGLEVYLSRYILSELRRVMPRLKSRHGLTEDEIDDLIDILSLQAEILEPLNVGKIEIRDLNDAPVLGTYLALESIHGGDYLITGDNDLLVLAEHYPIISPAEFCIRHDI